MTLNWRISSLALKVNILLNSENKPSFFHRQKVLGVFLQTSKTQHNRSLYTRVPIHITMWSRDQLCPLRRPPYSIHTPTHSCWQTHSTKHTHTRTNHQLGVIRGYFTVTVLWWCWWQADCTIPTRATLHVYWQWPCVSPWTRVTGWCGTCQVQFSNWVERIFPLWWWS